MVTLLSSHPGRAGGTAVAAAVGEPPGLSRAGNSLSASQAAGMGMGIPEPLCSHKSSAAPNKELNLWG